MAVYQNIFTQVQARTHPEMGADTNEADPWRIGSPGFVHWIGRIGNAQIGPMHLGWTGIFSLLSGFLAFEIIGLNMMASVDWNVAEFVRQLPWLALNPPAPEYGLAILPPLAEGGWWLIAGFFLTTSVILWCVRSYLRAKALGLGTHTTLGLRLGDLALSGAGFHPADHDGQLVRGGAVRHLPAPGLDWGVFDHLRQPVLQSVPLSLDRLPVRLDPAVRQARGDHPGDQPMRLGARGRTDHRSRHGLRAGGAFLALDHGVQRHNGIHPPLGLVVRSADDPDRRDRHPADRHGSRQLGRMGHRAQLRSLGMEQG